MTIYERIKNTADQKGFALSEVARRANIGEKSIYAWKPSSKYPNGITPKRLTLEKVADVLGVSVEYLLGNTDEMMPNKSTVPSEAKLDQALDRSISYDGKEITDHDRKLLKAMLTSYFENKDDNSK